MSQYELTFLLEEENELKNLEEMVQTSSGKIVSQEKWGKKDLSYPIKKQYSAYYYNIKFEIEASKVKELKKKLDFNEKLMRYLLLKISN